MLRVGILVESFRCAGNLPLEWQSENSALRQHLKFCNFQPVHCASKYPICPKVFDRFSKSVSQLEDFVCGHLGGKFQVRRYFRFAMAMWKLCALITFEILPLSTCTLCQQKSYISKGTRPIFEIFASTPTCWGWPFGWKVSSAQVFYVCNGNVKTLWIDNIWNFATFNLYILLQKSYISKGTRPIFEIFASTPTCWGWPFGWKVSSAQVFYVCNGNVKTLWIDNIWNFATFNLYILLQKSYISKGTQPIFEIFLSARRCWRWAFGWKVSSAQVINVGNGNVKTLSIDYISNFATFNLYTVPSNIVYLQRYSTDFRNLSLSSKILCVGIWVESFKCAGILGLQWQSENFVHWLHLKFCHFQPVHHANKNPISPKVLNRLSKSSPQLEDVEGGHFGWKFQGESFMGVSTTFEILPLSTCALCQQKSYISKGTQPIFEIFASARGSGGRAIGGKASSAQVFYVSNGNVKTLWIDNIWNFATFNLYTVPAKILYLQRYSTDFRNIFLNSNMLRVAIWVESFKCTGILRLQWQCENFVHWQHLKFCHFQPVHCASKNPISPKVLNRFSKSLP